MGCKYEMSSSGGAGVANKVAIVAVVAAPSRR